MTGNDRLLQLFTFTLGGRRIPCKLGVAQKPKYSGVLSLN